MSTGDTEPNLSAHCGPRPLRYRANGPCSDCPWRTDSDPTQFGTARWDQMLATAGAPGTEAPIGAPLFACHQSSEGREQACAGWLAAVGYHHLGVRVAAAQGRIPVETLNPESYDVYLYRSWDALLADKLPADPDRDHGQGRR
ncbi:hypothetical protein Ae168Ps1_6186 [Pseudonocardia sp. Ae168_Ps1]|uniref:DUF6283 family protein n=1 Tax=unclassified Pseudonocardia TaxID=2619320 RepID=UPI00094A9E7F|nr:MULTISPECIES: DUF6283 family protein [unclassified Pseudonocardia]OLL70439.1 hypothetical protein Ae168Ps1_6186 [Pseudonocardia sp. Ae168_Ps1]OLL71558.1 hypothetical protein Ae263Ps1_6046 [Pseudonocardia sp. Ae263_Ps1]